MNIMPGDADLAIPLPDVLAESNLSTREREVLRWIGEGKATKEIATILNVSVKTVETHRRNLMGKTGRDSVAGLTKLAILQGLTKLN